jgi:hypothetical protein
MPMVRCAHCDVRQYVPVTHASRLECVLCGRPISVSREALTRALIAAVGSAPAGAEKRPLKARSGR